MLRKRNCCLTLDLDAYDIGTTQILVIEHQILTRANLLLKDAVTDLNLPVVANYLAWIVQTNDRHFSKEEVFYLAAASELEDEQKLMAHLLREHRAEHDVLDVIKKGVESHDWSIIKMHTKQYLEDADSHMRHENFSAFSKAQAFMPQKLLNSTAKAISKIPLAKEFNG